MTIAARLAGAAQRDPMKHGHIVLDDAGGADDDARCVIHEDALADDGAGVNVRLENLRGEALERQGEIAAAILPEPMRQPIGLQRVEALEKSQADQEARLRAVADGVIRLNTQGSLAAVGQSMLSLVLAAVAAWIGAR